MKSLIARIMHYVHLIRRSHTLGVRAIVQKEDGSVLLVKHTYVPGWYLPGGGVEWGETLYQALEKELMEEAGVTLTEKAKMLAVYQNRKASKRDHVALYHCPNWRQDNKPNLPNHEIIAAEFFALNDLPDGTTDATKRRLAEHEAGGPFSDYW
ncbi:MAG: NUDIX domain-containing protein [Hyphomicrobiales bacterium]